MLFFQGKVRQNSLATLGDVALKEFVGSLSQFNSSQKIELILQGNANAALKNLLIHQEVKQKLESGYSVRGVFLTNSDPDDNATMYLRMHPEIRLYGKTKVCSEYVDLDLESGVESEFTFSCESEPLAFSVSTLAKMYLFLATGQDLISIPGISDGQLFSQNVRLSLGNTDVNKAIVRTLKQPQEHKKFPLFHNGITLLCDKAEYQNLKLTVKNFVVVNGAQSLTALHNSRDDLTSDLRILLRVIEVSGNRDLSNQITQISNTQNAIRPRDMRSNHALQTRLKREFEQLSYDGFVFEVKRGEANERSQAISNDEAGRLLLAFDLQEPYSCHQIYKVFDEYYSRIFGRPEVNAKRIIFLYLLMQTLKARLGDIQNRAFAGYTLTRFFLFDVLGHIMRKDVVATAFVADPTALLADRAKLQKFLAIIDDILRATISDLNYAISDKGEGFDYKSLLKNQSQIVQLRKELMQDYDRELARKRTEPISEIWQKATSVS
jgi:hypothetical protein